MTVDCAVLKRALADKRAELNRVAPPGSAWGGIVHDRHRADELSGEIRAIECAMAAAGCRP